MIYIACDHAGFNFKKEIGDYLAENGLDFKDLGPSEMVMDDDYPDYAQKMGEVFKPEEDLGILICGSGQGMCLTINKYPGIRAAQAWSMETAILARHDDNCNVLCLGQEVENIDSPTDIVSAFLNTDFESIDKRTRRLKKVEDIEKNITK
jgi:ribose 5-phosphate isomerase B